MHGSTVSTASLDRLWPDTAQYGRAGAAEVEVLLARMADRPRAARTRELDHHLPLRRPLERRRPRLQRQAMRLADHGIFGQAEPPPDLGGGVPFLPQAAELIDKIL